MVVVEPVIVFCAYDNIRHYRNITVYYVTGTTTQGIQSRKSYPQVPDRYNKNGWYLVIPSVKVIREGVTGARTENNAENNSLGAFSWCERWRNDGNDSSPRMYPSFSVDVSSWQVTGVATKATMTNIGVAAVHVDVIMSPAFLGPQTVHYRWTRADGVFNVFNGLIMVNVFCLKT